MSQLQQTLERQATIVNRQGLHARPIVKLFDAVKDLEAEITLCANGHEADGKSVMAMMMLVAEKGTVLTLRAVGREASRALEAMAQLIANGFGEEIDDTIANASLPNRATIDLAAPDGGNRDGPIS